MDARDGYHSGHALGHALGVMQGRLACEEAVQRVMEAWHQHCAHGLIPFDTSAAHCAALQDLRDRLKVERRRGSYDPSATPASSPRDPARGRCRVGPACPGACPGWDHACRVWQAHEQ
jgi:hypothetical protein